MHEIIAVSRRYSGMVKKETKTQPHLYILRPERDLATDSKHQIKKGGFSLPVEVADEVSSAVGLSRFLPPFEIMYHPHTYIYVHKEVKTQREKRGI